MVKITKPRRSPMMVTEAAYENFYKSAGWIMATQPVSRKKGAAYAGEESETETDEWDNVDDEFESEKSLSEMTVDELREKAASMGIDLSGATTPKQIRDKIKRYM